MGLGVAPRDWDEAEVQRPVQNQDGDNGSLGPDSMWPNDPGNKCSLLNSPGEGRRRGNRAEGQNIHTLSAVEAGRLGTVT